MNQTDRERLIARLVELVDEGAAIPVTRHRASRRPLRDNLGGFGPPRHVTMPAYVELGRDALQRWTVRVEFALDDLGDGAAAARAAWKLLGNQAGWSEAELQCARAIIDALLAEVRAGRVTVTVPATQHAASTSAKTNRTAFVSYSHDSPAHKARVLDLSQHLRLDSIDVVLDQFNEAPPEGWHRWMSNGIMDAQYVLVICTKTYRARAEGRAPAGSGAGASLEGGVISQELFETNGRNTKFIPVIFDGDDTEERATFLRPHTYYRWPSEREKLLRRLTSQPAIVPAPLGSPPVLPPHSGVGHGPLVLSGHAAPTNAAVPVPLSGHAAPTNAAVPVPVAKTTTVNLSGRLFRGSAESTTAEKWVVRLHSAIGTEALDLVGTAAWFQRIGEHYVVLADPGVARAFIGPPELHRDGDTILATMVVRPEPPRTPVGIIGRSMDLGRDFPGGAGLTPGGISDVRRKLEQGLSTGVGEVLFRSGVGSFMAAYARMFASDRLLLADLVAIEIARLAFLTSVGEERPSLTFVRGVKRVALLDVPHDPDHLVANLDLDLVGSGEWTGRVAILVSDPVAAHAQRALDQLGESLREKCVACGLPAMGTSEDLNKCGNCGAVGTPRPTTSELSPELVERVQKSIEIVRRRR